ncbi:sigma-70 family RNA polymerase sigma factor [Compostibacter hankyongensis]|uniref:Sigma-70 family RNA polymerase sigma factor n=1 Tax=Compostibacter hankyongensis TaxID=1007089 RepID=A0ABP8FN63_9BACT
MERPIAQVEDIELWKSFKSGSEAAYRRLYEQYAPVLYSYGCKVCNDEPLVKDCLQDLFFNVWRTRDNLSYTTSIKYYLFRALRREIIRKLSRRLEIAHRMAGAGLEMAERSAEEILIANEDVYIRDQTLKQALSRLSVRQREAIYLRFYENAPFEDIAAIMNITPRAAYKLIYRAIEALQKTYVPARGMSAELLGLLLILAITA